jgi:hypothetical protein
MTKREEAAGTLNQTIHRILTARGFHCCEGVRGRCASAKEILTALWQQEGAVNLYFRRPIGSGPG